MEFAMHPKLPLAVVAVLLTVVPVAAEDCPVRSFQMDDIVVALNATTGCEAAMKAFAACQMGSTADVQFGDIVEKKCEAEFLSRLSTPRRRVYEDQLGRCSEKYADKQGTMWRSATAVCRAGIAQRYAHRLGK
jgi:hypothetical protein